MAANRMTSALSDLAKSLKTDRHGNFAIATALLLPILVLAAGGAVDVSRAFNEKTHLQEKLDSAVLAAVHTRTLSEQQQTIQNYLSGISSDYGTSLTDTLNVTQGSDGSVIATMRPNYPMTFLSMIGIPDMALTVSSRAIADADTADTACIHVLANKDDAVLINSGATVRSSKCEAHILSTAAKTFTMNSGSTIDLAKFCVKGTGYLKNGGTLSNLEMNCNAKGDPYVGKFAEPTIPKTCTTQGPIDSTTITFKPGLHCYVNTNSPARITFSPGLHIIQGTMNIASNSTIIANGVTFYFPDTNSGLRGNGGITFTGAAPTSGPYAGILMFEKTSNATNNANKQQYIFNGGKSESYEGIIYLPNRDLVFNSTTQIDAKLSLVANSMIINTANWTLAPYSGGSSGGSGVKNVRLVN